MNQRDLAWKRFETSGRVEDYLAYRGQCLSAALGSEEEENHALIHRRRGAAGETHWQRR